MQETTHKSPELYLKLFTGLVSTGNFNEAIGVELEYYSTYVKPTESLQNWNFWDDQTYNIRKHLYKFASGFERTLAKGEQVDPSILIIFHNYSGLAHENQLARRFGVMRSNGFSKRILIVYLFGESNSLNLSRKIWNFENVEIFYFKSKSYTNAFFKLQQFIDYRTVHTILYPSIYFLASWCSSFLKHKDQRFYVMKYLPKLVGNFSCWFGGLGKSKYADNMSSTRFFELGAQMPTAPGIKSYLSNPSNIRFGSISRVEKILSEEFWRIILRILHNSPNAQYLITVRNEDFLKLPVSIRNHQQIVNLGWVDPNASILEFDVYVDPFPWGGGDMSFLAVATGIPYVSLATDLMSRVGPLDTIVEIANGNPRLLSYLCKTEEILEDKVCSLIQSERERSEVGLLWKLSAHSYNETQGDGWNFFFSDEFRILNSNSLKSLMEPTGKPPLFSGDRN